MKRTIHPTDIVRDPNGQIGLVSDVSEKGRCIVLYKGDPERTIAWNASVLTKITPERPMSDAQTLTERHTRGVLTYVCPICGGYQENSAAIDLLRYPNGTTYATGVFTDRHPCQPKETQ